MFILFTAPMCQGCHKVSEAMKELGIPFEERDIRTLTEDETVDVIVNLRASGWSDKLIFAEVEGDVKPILQAPILWNQDGAIWPGLLVPDGREANMELLRCLV